MKRRDFIKSVAALSAAGSLLNLHGAMALAEPTGSVPVPAIDLWRDVTAIMGERGQLAGGLKGCPPIISGFNSSHDTVTWTVNAPREDDYAVGLIFSSPEQRKIEVRAGESILQAQSLLRTWENRPFFWRQELPGILHLKAGKNRIVFRLPDAKQANASKLAVCGKHRGGELSPDFALRSIELGTPAARKAQLLRAKEIRGDASWMIAGKYGQFVHWSAQSYPLYGNEKRAEWFQKSVEIFDVKVFADAVERSGPAWVTFTATHQGFYWPGPNAALDKILPGRTAQRDLLGEIIAELGRRNIRTLLYLHTGYNGYESEFWKASGAADADRKRFSNNIAAIMRDCSLRYGKKLSGFGYIDGAFGWLYPLDPCWEDWARAIKAGNYPAALVGFSSNRGPTVSPFNDLAVTDSAQTLTRPDPMLIGPGRQLGDVTSAAWFCMDKDGWISHKPMNGTISRGPAHSTQEYVDYFQRMAAAKVPVTVNMIMTADVTNQHPLFNPKCTAVMEQVRKAIRGA